MSGYNQRIEAKVEFYSDLYAISDSITTIFHNGRHHGYRYYDDIENKELDIELFITETKRIVSQGLRNIIYLYDQEYLSHFYIEHNLLTLIPIKPFKFKAGKDGKKAIDLAFYINQMLNLCDNVEIEQLYTKSN